jgi:hypothetical protein
LTKFASKIRVSTHGLEATEADPRPSAILPGVDRELYRRRQRRRAIVGWSTFALLVALVALAVIFGGESERSTMGPSVDLFAAEMTSEQYEAIHKGQAEAAVLTRLGNVGLQEDQVEESELLGLFPARPDHSICSYWTLSDAPGHLVRLCFSNPQSVLLQKAVAAAGEDAAPTTLA